MTTTRASSKPALASSVSMSSLIALIVRQPEYVGRIVTVTRPRSSISTSRKMPRSSMVKTGISGSVTRAAAARACSFALGERARRGQRPRLQRRGPTRSIGLPARTPVSRRAMDRVYRDKGATAEHGSPPRVGIGALQELHLRQDMPEPFAVDAALAPAVSGAALGASPRVARVRMSSIAASNSPRSVDGSTPKPDAATSRSRSSASNSSAANGHSSSSALCALAWRSRPCHRRAGSSTRRNGAGDRPSRAPRASRSPRSRRRSNA